jgi:type VI secretion system protein ImpK
MSDMQAPSLLAGLKPGLSHRTQASTEAKSLCDLMADGFYMLFLLKNRHAPTSADEFRARIKDFIAGFDRACRRLDVPSEDAYLCKYAFCAVVDETVLMTQERLRDAWGRKPLQLELFGDQLAGESFFERLEEVRQRGHDKVGVLEVFHMCLLVGFQGKYLLEGTEKLGYLTSRLGDEIAHHKGKRVGFAPHWDAPDRIMHKLRAEIPLWIIGSVFALAGLLAFMGLRWTLAQQTRGDLGPYAQVVKMPPQTASITITLP